MQTDDGWLYDINGFDVRQEVAREMEDAFYNLAMDMSMYANDEHPDPDWEAPSGAYGCMACEECYAREHLFVQTRIIAMAVLAGTIRLTRINEIAPDVDTSAVVPLIEGVPDASPVVRSLAVVDVDDSGTDPNTDRDLREWSVE